MNSQEVVTLVVGIVVPIISLIIALLSFRRNTKKDLSEKEQKEGALFTELGYIKSGIDRIDKRTEQLERRQNEQDRILTALDVKVDAHLKDRNAHNYKGA